MRKADEEYDLIKDKDVIGVGISGGKDSSLLLYCLNLYKHLAKNALNKEYTIVPIHIDLNFGEQDFTILQDYFKSEGIHIIYESSKIADILKLNMRKERIDCSLCSTLKKGAVIKTAKEHGCNKVAFAHHADDAIETMMLNVIYGAKLATFDPIMHLSDSDITFIRPFIYTFENDIQKAVKQLEIPIIKSNCPNDGFTKREDVKQLMHQIYHSYPGSKNNFLKALHNKEQINLFDLKNSNYDHE